MTGRHWLAIAIAGSGLVTLGAMALYARGRKEEAFALAFTAGLLSTTFAAAKALNEREVDHPKPQAQPGGVDAAGWGLA